MSVSESVISILRFSLVARCPMTLKCQFHFFPLVLLQSRPVGRLGLQVKTKKQCSALQCSGNCGNISQDLLQTQSRSAHSQFPGKILRNIIFYEVGTRECSADKNIVLKRLTLKIVFFILLRKILIKSAKSGEFVKDRPCSSKWRVVTGHQCDVATM